MKEDNTQHKSIVGLMAATIRQHWDVDALSDLDGAPISYGELAAAIARTHQVLMAGDIKPGDKVAICAKNSMHWAITFVSCLTYGAVAVPILHDFKPETIQKLVDHSDSKAVFVDDLIRRQLDIALMPKVAGFFDIETGRPWKARDKRLETAYDRIDQIIADVYGAVDKSNFSSTYAIGANPDDTAIINYTSGSTGQPKGVMLSYESIWSNAKFAVDNIHFYQPGDGMVSMLPLAHMFGLLVELIFPLLKGCHITFLGRVPSPKILLDAFARIKPKMVVTVPLVIEKIVYNKVFPTLHKPLLKILTRIPGINRLIFNKVRKQMIDAFGGNLLQLIIGGAALSKDVENFLLKIRFPYTVGYGMTECGPLIAYCFWDKQKQGSCGRIVDRMQARVDSPDPAHIPGVLWVKGDNVMKGYYHNEEATCEVFDKDHWMNTGDICVLDPDGYLFIRGRDKSMILGPSGQNIYPEEIENKLNHLRFVAESVVVDRDGKLVALVHPDLEGARKARVSREKLDEIMDYNLTALNRELPSYSKVSAMELRDEPFEKTPKQSIKRFLYK